jgi:hypothetical protein
MYTDQFSTDGTGPATVFIPDELSDTNFFYLHQILYHAHAISCSISLIQVLQAPTREGQTGMITVFPFTFSAETQSTFLTAFGVGCQTAITFILGTNISNAKPAIHSTWSYVRYLGMCFHEGYYIYLLA